MVLKTQRKATEVECRQVGMKTFAQFLEEGRDAPLYHGTTYGALEKIISSWEVLPKTHHPHFKLLMGNKSDRSDITQYSGISTTRSLKFAKAWNSNAVIVFDQRRVAQKYKIVPIQYYTNLQTSRFVTSRQNSKNEYEEFIVTNKPVSLNYASKILVSDELIKDLEPKYVKALENAKIPLEAF